MIKAGITGTIAAGKSTVSLILREMGFTVFDSDLAARQCLDPGESGYVQVIEHFGREILRDDETVDRKKLASLIFADEEKREELNGIVHPYVKQKMFDCFREHDSEKIVFAEVPLLFEVGWQDLFDLTITVTCEDETAINRCIRDRGYTRKEAEERLASQIGRKAQIEASDIVFYNDGTVEELRDKLRQWLKEAENGIEG